MEQVEIERQLRTIRKHDALVNRQLRKLKKDILSRSKFRVKNLFWISLIVSILTIGFCVFVICIGFPRLDDVNGKLDYWGIILGVLGVLITVLVGWQIYQIVNFDKKTDQIFEKINKENQRNKINLENIVAGVSEASKKVADTESKINNIYMILNNQHNENLYLEGFLSGGFIDLYKKLYDSTHVPAFLYSCLLWGINSIGNATEIQKFDLSNTIFETLFNYIPDFSAVVCRQEEKLYVIDLFNRVQRDSRLIYYDRFLECLNKITVMIVHDSPDEESPIE